MRNTLVSVFILLVCFQLYGQENRKEICIGFRVGKSTLDVNYGNNEVRLTDIISYIDSIKNDNTLELVEVSFHGSASPEGPIKLNKKLSASRLSALEKYVRDRVSLPDSIVTRYDETVGWDRLALLVEQSDMPNKEEALNILRNIPEFTFNENRVLVDSRKKHMMDMLYGRTWNYMYKHFFEQVRNASVIFVTVRPVAQITEEIVEQPDLSQPIVPEVETEPSASTETFTPTSMQKKPFYMALKTNMLYDAAAVPNLGVEFYLGKNWSLGGNWMYSWWNSNKHHRYWRIYGGDIELRKWLGKKAQEKPLTGHHLGIYGQVFTYDFEWGKKGYMGGKPGGTLWDKQNYITALEYGYALPITKRLNLDFGIGVGYWWGKYYTYIPLDGYYVWQSTRNRHWFGPTKAEVSLVWLLGRDNINKKGGIK